MTKESSSPIKCCPLCMSKKIKVTPFMNQYRVMWVDAYKVECDDCKKHCYVDGPYVGVGD